MLSGAKPTNFSRFFRQGQQHIRLGDNEWRGEEVRHDERDAAFEPLFCQPVIYQADAVPVRDISMCFIETYSSSVRRLPLFAK